MIQVTKNLNCYKKLYFTDTQTAKGKYNQNYSIKFETGSVKPSLVDYSDAFNLVTRNITHRFYI